MKQSNKIKTISEYHRWSFPEPVQSLISLVDLATVSPEYSVTGVVINFYSVCIKRSSNIKLKYGQQEYDFDNGVMFFMSPKRCSIIPNGFTIVSSSQEKKPIIKFCNAWKNY